MSNTDPRPQFRQRRIFVTVTLIPGRDRDEFECFEIRAFGEDDARQVAEARYPGASFEFETAC